MSQTDTRLAVVYALDERMRSLPIDHIRVTDLCRAVGISRATFYEYFDDVYDIVIWMWEYLMGPSLFQIGRTLDCYEAYLRKLEALMGHRAFFASAARTSGKTAGHITVCRHESDVMLDRYEQLFEDKTGRRPCAEERLELEFFAVGSAHMTEQWLNQPDKIPTETLARTFTQAAPIFLRKALEA